MYSFEEVDEGHLLKLTEILNHYIQHTTVTFHTQPLTVFEMAEKVFFTQPYHRAFVIKYQADVIGYCAVSQWKKQEAYRHTAEINVYLHHRCIGQGIGSMAIQHLEAFARDNDIHTLIAGLCSENTPSRRLFEKNGYAHCAHFQKVGQKFGRQLDVIYMQKIL